MNDEKINFLERRIASLEKINKVLMGRVERSIDDSGDAYSIFERNIVLQQSVEARTRELEVRNQQLAETLKNLQGATDQLVQSEKLAALGGLVAGVAHEVNTPIGIGLTAASHFQILVRDINQQFNAGLMKKSDLIKFLVSCEESAAIIVANLTRAGELIHSFKKVAVDSTSEQLQTIDLNAYIRDIILTLSPQIKKTKVEICVDCPENLTIHTFPGSISQIITNLVMNAIIHAFEGDRAGMIVLSAKAVGEGYRDLSLIVSDNGRGISPENLTRIFEPFFTTKRGQGGSGLGLHLIYNIITKTLRGSIMCESTLGKGSRFVMVFPDCVSQLLKQAA